jgi:membrane fusion protein (multidrug efflux system)
MTKKKTNTKFIIIISLLLGVTYGTYKYIHSLSHEGTDDAQIEKNMNNYTKSIGLCK